MMHSAITIGGKRKHEAGLLQPLQQICCLTMEARHLTTATTAVASSVSISLHCVTQQQSDSVLAEERYIADQKEKMGFQLR